MVKLVAVPIRVDREVVTYRDSFGQPVAVDSLGYMVTFHVNAGRVDGELRLPMNEPPALGEEYEIVIRRVGVNDGR